MERRQFGTVLTRKRDDGTIQTWIARYAYKGIRCQKAFGPDGRVSAEKWLEEEKLLIDLDKRGVMEWNPPQTRESQRKALELTFNEYATTTSNTIEGLMVANSPADPNAICRLT